MISGNHDRLDTRRPALSNRLLGFLPRRIHLGDQAKVSQIVLIGNIQCLAGELLCSEAEHTQPLFGEFLHLFHDLLLLRLRTCHAIQQHIGCALGVHLSHTTALVQGRHQLSVGVKGNLADSCVALPHLGVRQSASLRKPHQCCFCWVADLRAVLIGGIVTEHRRQNQLLFLRIFRTYIVCSDDVILHHDFPNGHLVLGQSAGLIRADDRDRAKSLYCLKLPHDGVFTGHLLCAEREHNGDNRAERLRNCRNCQRNGKHQGGHHGVKVHGIRPHQTQHKYQCADDQNGHGEPLAELIQCLLQRRFSRLSILNQ